MRQKNLSDYVKRSPQKLEAQMNQTAPTPYGFRKAVSLVMDDLALAKRHSQEKEEEKVQQPLQSQETIYDKKIMERRKKLKEEKNIRMSKL